MSGIYISGIEMPESCGECKFFVWKRGVGQYCAVDDRITFHATIDGMDVAYEHNGNCPLVPVPDHGRLINADALCVRLKMMYAQAFGDGNSAYHSAYRSLEKVVEHEPTVIDADKEGLVEAQDSKLSATIKCGGVVTCAVAYSEEVYDKYVDTVGNLRWTGTHSGEHIISAEEGET